MPGKWEYKIEPRSECDRGPAIGIVKPFQTKTRIVERFNALGAEGWEYVGLVSDGLSEEGYLFKRQLTA